MNNAPDALRRPTAPTHRAILSIALPIMISNVSTPLLGIVDTGVVGQIPDPAYIGAVAIGSLIFTSLFWAFGFLRMGTTGLTAQASGAKDSGEIRASLGRAVLVAICAGAGLIVLKWPIREVSFALLQGSEGVERLAGDYYDIRIWAAPATLMNYVLLGWFVGLARTDIALILQLVLNITNMALDALFVLGLGWDVQGVAAGTVLAEMTAAAVGLAFAARQLSAMGGRWERAKIFDRARLRRTVAIHRDIMIRSLALIAVFAWFTAQGAKQGDVILAGNTLLMHFISAAAFFLDGIAFAAEVLVGKAAGAGRRAELRTAVRMTTVWAAGGAAVVSMCFALVGTPCIDVLTVDESVRAAARTYLPWAVVAPLAGVWCFQLDGIFIGATRAQDMRNAMLMSLAIFLAAWWVAAPYGNHGLWAALYVHYAARTGTLLAYFPGLVRSMPA